jgi:hypothetical protein
MGWNAAFVQWWGLFWVNAGLALPFTLLTFFVSE